MAIKDFFSDFNYVFGKCTLPKHYETPLQHTEHSYSADE